MIAVLLLTLKNVTGSSSALNNYIQGNPKSSQDMPEQWARILLAELIHMPSRCLLCVQSVATA